MTLPIAMIVIALLFNTVGIVMAGNSSEAAGIGAMISTWFMLVAFIVSDALGIFRIIQ